MKKVAVTTTIIASILLSSASAMADSRPNDRNYNNNDHKITARSVDGVNPTSIELRISQGIKSGKLTTSEAERLVAGLNSLKATIRAVYKDNKVTHQEKNQVQKKDNQLNREITKLLNNKATVKQRHGNNRH